MDQTLTRENLFFEKKKSYVHIAKSYHEMKRALNREPLRMVSTYINRS